MPLFNIRLSDDEKALLQKMADEAGVTMTQFVKQALFTPERTSCLKPENKPYAPAYRA